jgi:hypothetical protein
VHRIKNRADIGSNLKPPQVTTVSSDEAALMEVDRDTAIDQFTSEEAKTERTVTVAIVSGIRE